MTAFGIAGLFLIFLSTPSARRATKKAGGRVDQSRISIHALREEGDDAPAPRPWLPMNFYPRPPRGGRQVSLYEFSGGWKFLSTPSARRAT